MLKRDIQLEGGVQITENTKKPTDQRRPPAEKVKGVVYKVNCSCGSTYMGETHRTLEVRLKEHQRVVKSRQTNNGIAVHANNTQYSIQWDSAEVVCQEMHWHKRKVQ